MPELLPEIQSVAGGNVAIKLLNGATSIVPDNVRQASDILDVQHPQYEVVRHLLEIVSNAGMTLGEAAANPSIQSRLANFEVTLSSRIEN